MLFMRAIQPDERDTTKILDMRFDNYVKVPAGWLSETVELYRDGKLFQREEYSDVQDEHSDRSEDIRCACREVSACRDAMNESTHDDAALGDARRPWRKHNRDQKLVDALPRCTRHSLGEILSRLGARAVR